MPVSSERTACERVVESVVQAGRYTRNIINGCGHASDEDAPNYFVVRLNTHCREEICGSVLLGWFAVNKQSGRVFNWDVGEGQVAGEVASIEQQ